MHIVSLLSVLGYVRSVDPWQPPGSSEGEGVKPLEVRTYDFAKCFKKLREIEKIWGLQGPWLP